MYCDFYNLPDITIIGGDTFPINFDLYRDKRHSVPYEVTEDFIAYFSMAPYLNRDLDAPLLTLSTIPMKVLYASQALSTPTSSYDSYSTSSSTTWHKTKSSSDHYVSYSYDGLKWSAPEDALVAGYRNTSPRLFIDDSDNVLSNITLEFRVEDTINLRGKFIYQITLIDNLGDIEVLGQGTITIIKNIDPGLIS